jgi:hypothetical protein
MGIKIDLILTKVTIMLVSRCCNAKLLVQSADCCAYYICTECELPTDERCSFLMKDEEDAT